MISKETRPIQSGDTKSDVTAHTHKGSSGADIVNGISNVLKLRISENEFEINHDRKIIGSIDSAAIKTEIDSGRPLIIGMEKSLGGEDHWVVGYGYQDYTYPAGHKNEGETYSGYIVHFGWPDKTSIWVNESWCNEYISLDIKHEHDLCVDTEKNIGNDKREIRCDECGYRTVDELYTLNQNGDMITGCKYDRVGTVVVPSQINGITITSIGNSAFANQTQITSKHYQAQ